MLGRGGPVPIHKRCLQVASAGLSSGKSLTRGFNTDNDERHFVSGAQEVSRSPRITLQRLKFTSYLQAQSRDTLTDAYMFKHMRYEFSPQLP